MVSRMGPLGCQSGSRTTGMGCLRLLSKYLARKSQYMACRVAACKPEPSDVLVWSVHVPIEPGIVIVGLIMYCTYAACTYNVCPMPAISRLPAHVCGGLFLPRGTPQHPARQRTTARSMWDQYRLLLG